MPKLVTNRVSIHAKLTAAMQTRRFIGIAYSAANTRCVFAKHALMQDIDADPVTKELNDKSTAHSNYIDHGTLRSYLGFSPSDTPVNDLKQYLQANIYLEDRDNVEIATSRNIINYKFKVNVPTLRDTDEALPPPDEYSSKSWVRIIEEGIGGMASALYYYFHSKAFKDVSRSGIGIQRKVARKDGGQFNPTDYISKLLKKLIDRF